MYHAETEDMLPRPAPQPSVPSASVGSETLVKPQVPEVSLLYGPQQGTRTVNPSKTQAVPTQTYAAWRKQVLPKVTFPPEGAEVTDIIPVATVNSCIPAAPEPIKTRSNLYPLRTITATIPPKSALSAPVQRTAPYYRRSLDNAPSSDDVFGLYNPTIQLLKQTQRRSMESITRENETHTQPAAEVLTICASTQTDFTNIDHPMRDVATKQDLEQILTLVQTMREDQTRILQMCEKMLMGKRKPDEDPKTKIHVKDISIQCELMQPAASEQQSPEIPAAALQLQPLNNGHVPVAQSTAYRANTPRCHRAPLTYNNAVSALPKPSTEKSMMMNELALKYLPNGKLTELLQELHLQPKAPQAVVVTPLRAVENIENIEKSPAELSNASYKYLKKYRLLSDEHAGACVRSSPPQLRCEPLLDLEHIRNQPKFL